MHPCPGNWVAIGCVVMYYAQAFGAGIKRRHCAHHITPVALQNHSLFVLSVACSISYAWSFEMATVETQPTEEGGRWGDGKGRGRGTHGGDDGARVYPSMMTALSLSESCHTDRLPGSQPKQRESREQCAYFDCNLSRRCL